jgi:DNA polymerase elongation subunit (family B)
VEQFIIDTEQSYTDLYGMIDSGELTVENCNEDTMLLRHGTKNGAKLLQVKFTGEFKPKSDEINDLVYGISPDEKIVNISVKNDIVYLFKEINGEITYETKEYKHWLLSPKFYSGFKKLQGYQHFKYFAEYNAEDFEYNISKQIYKRELYTIWNKPENYMVKNGFTYFKNTKINEVSVLSFDIETTGLNPKARDAKVLMITNCYRKQGILTYKHFVVDDFNDQYEMIKCWSSWIREMDPSIIIGHNIVMFDIPYLQGIMDKIGELLVLGRLNEPIEIEEKERELRKDGSQSYTYKRINVFGRELVDTFFVSIKYDVGRKYESYNLKSIVKFEGLEKQGRVHYDASQIKYDWNDLSKRKQIIEYAVADSEDPIKLFDLMIPAFFYMNVYVPKTLQSMTETATGGQINSMLVRGYLQKGYSIPKASETDYVQGGISFAIPGVYKNVYKIDIKSAYPSQILRLKLYSKEKDPFKYFYKMTKYFTEARFKFKQKSKETSDPYWLNMDQSAKIVINSLYGACQTSGLNFNDPEIAARITLETRLVIDKALKWASGNGVDFWMSKFKGENNVT